MKKRREAPEGMKWYGVGGYKLLLTEGLSAKAMRWIRESHHKQRTTALTVSMQEQQYRSWQAKKENKEWYRKNNQK